MMSVDPYDLLCDQFVAETEAAIAEYKSSKEPRDCGADLKEHPTYIATYTGRAVDFFDPKPDTIWCGDIAHAGALTCRFGGHVRTFYSVAEHCVRVSWLLRDRGYDRETQFYGLMHDAAESYIGDIVTQVKRKVPEFKVIENRLLDTIYERYGLAGGEPAAVKQADSDILIAEAQDLFTPEAFQTWFSYLGDRPEDIDEIKPWDWQTAEDIYMQNFLKLARGRQ